MSFQATRKAGEHSSALNHDFISVNQQFLQVAYRFVTILLIMQS